HVALPEKVKPKSEIDKFLSDIPKSSLQEIEVLPDHHAVNKRIVDLKFPRSAFIVMIKRNHSYIRPGGSTKIEPGDILMVLADRPEDFQEVESILLKP